MILNKEKIDRVQAVLDDVNIHYIDKLRCLAEASALTEEDNAILAKTKHRDYVKVLNQLMNDKFVLRENPYGKIES